MIDTLPVRLIARALLPASWMVALAFLVKGHAETGDGFSAALIAGAGVLIQFLVQGRKGVERLLAVRYAHVLCGAGLLLLLGTGFAPVLVGMAAITHFPRPGSEAPSFGMIELHTGFAIEVGIFLVVLGFLLSVMDLLARTADRAADEEASS